MEVDSRELCWCVWIFTFDFEIMSWFRSISLVFMIVAHKFTFLLCLWLGRCPMPSHLARSLFFAVGFDLGDVPISHQDFVVFAFYKNDVVVWILIGKLVVPQLSYFFNRDLFAFFWYSNIIPFFIFLLSAETGFRTENTTNSKIIKACLLGMKICISLSSLGKFYRLMIPLYWPWLLGLFMEMLFVASCEYSLQRLRAFVDSFNISE